ncbi:phosphate transporter PHO1-like [Vicia villosa]|uniref:phosphate transporter PHO1-like n=1 Tax=Vicia villosa TaxID=3911 RepID=UPI00273B0384|nr:phosphate transporter PHO1-like [Vicia villosa]
MVKFGHELSANMIQEWKEEYMDYGGLKKLIKMMKESKISNRKVKKMAKKIHERMSSSSSNCRNSMSNSVSSIGKKFTSFLSPTKDIIQLRKINTVNSEEGIYEYKTDVLSLSSQDNVSRFFVSLDVELNKINSFFIKKESEFSEREDTLKKLLQILLDFKKIIMDRRHLTNIAQEAPPQTQDSNSLEFISITNELREDLVNHPTRDFHQEIHNAHKVLRSAFVEFYQSLDSLKIYSSLNMTAFSKILKKFDKVSSQKVSESYLKAMQKSRFVSCDKVVRLMDEMESKFSKHFTNNDKKKTMKFLKPKQNKDSNMMNFFVGLSAGCFVTLFCVYALLAHFYGVFSHSNEKGYMKIMFPILSVFTLLSLHLFLYGCNLYMWERTRINYNLIFDFSPRKSLHYRDVFLACSTLMTIVFGAMVIHLILGAAGFSICKSAIFPGIVLLFFIGLLIFPFNIFYRPTRYFFIRAICKIICSLFFKVMLIDVFMADQLTSQIPLIRHLGATGYNFFLEVLKIHPRETRNSRRIYMEIIYFISFFPYLCRAFQCIRRWYDDGDLNNLANMVKYVSAIVAGGTRVAYKRQHGHLWLAICVITSFVTGFYNTYWDIVKDGDFCNFQSTNRGLRDNLVLKNKRIYFVSIALNIILRGAWVHSTILFEAGPAKVGLLEFSMAVLEVIRRGHWSFYRVEVEQARINARQ